MGRNWSSMEILLIDDELTIRNGFKSFFEDNGFRVRLALNGKKGIEEFKRSPPDLVLLDVMMPVMGGYDAAAAIRAFDRETPIVFLSALSSDENQLRGFEVGADDYVTKSESLPLLLARVKKSLKRAHRFSSFEAPLAMTKTEANIYRLLASDRGRFFSYREIFESICGEGYYADEGAIRSHVSRIRGKLPSGEKMIAKRGRGYALV